ncbi:hypothetical protein J1605_009636 [Eschrichtius robustus]|uniref:Anillin homology domain-containing protein n=1 Tax=Eschrichtius robustus TaxID=9764 RepID=A0AB34GUS7_ESCRO|nr:hypothetical protein J1605_009636 [Eschrichtius robustus]
MRKTGQRPPGSRPPAERSPCRGQVCTSDLRIPLMWKDTEDFKNEGNLHHRAVFLLLQTGECAQDTETILVDRTLTAVSFHNNVLFAEAGPDSELRLELYGACVEEEGALAGAPKRLATKLSSCLGCSSGRRVQASLETARGSGSSPILLPTPAAGGPRYHRLAHTTLTLAAVQDGFHTHDLTLTSHEDPAWLPLDGSVCCCLVAQPFCVTQPTAGGTLRAQQAGELQDWVRVHGVLKGTNRFCYHQPEDTDTEEEPLFTAVINKETQVRAGELDKALLSPLDDITAVTDSLAQREGTRLETPPACPAWPLLACFSGPNPSPAPFPVLEEMPNGLPGCCPPRPLPWGFSLCCPSPPPKRSPQSRGLCSKGPPHTWLQSPV